MTTWANGAIGRWRGASRRRRVLTVISLPVAAGLLVIGPPLAVFAGTSSHRYGSVADVPPAPVALVLGAGVDAAGNPSPFLSARISIGVELYRAGTVRALLMSGDNSRHDYDEVGIMAAQAQRLGVPAAAIVQDHAGFDTYSSCYRARSVWGISRVVVVSQPFHLPRAVWLCRELGLDAVGAEAASSYRNATWYGWLREVPAIDKSVLDTWRGRTPTFPGPREHTLDAVNAARTTG